jgi:hypothetical protein
MTPASAAEAVRPRRLRGPGRTDTPRAPRGVTQPSDDKITLEDGGHGSPATGEFRSRTQADPALRCWIRPRGEACCDQFEAAESSGFSWKEPPPGAVQALLLLVRRPISGSSDLASAHACLRGDALVRLHRCGRLPSRVSDHSRRKAPECALREIITEVQNIEIACLRDLGDGARQNIGNHIARGRLSGLDLRPADTGHIDTALRGPGRSRYRMRRNSHACRAKARSGCR